MIDKYCYSLIRLLISKFQIILYADLILFVYQDGKPASRHVYQHNHWVPAINRIIMCGAKAVFGRAIFWTTIDGFNPDTNEWDPQNTWPNMTLGYGVVRERNSSIIWGSAFVRIDLAAREFTKPITTGDLTVSMRWPMTHDTKRHQLFNLQFGDGQGYDLQLGIQAARIPLNGNRRIRVTFKNNTATDLFYAEVPTYASLDYDPINDRFLFYSGQKTAAGRIYVVTPSDTSDEWEMSLFPLAEGSAMPSPVPLSGLQRRFMYVPGLNVFVMMPNGDANIYFLRVGSYGKGGLNTLVKCHIIILVGFAEQVPQTAPQAAGPHSPAAGPQSSSTPAKNSVSSTAIQSTMVNAALVTLSAALTLF